MRVNIRHFAVIGHKLFRRGANDLLRRCVSEVEVPSILAVCQRTLGRGVNHHRTRVLLSINQILEFPRI